MIEKSRGADFAAAGAIQGRFAPAATSGFQLIRLAESVSEEPAANGLGFPQPPTRPQRGNADSRIYADFRPDFKSMCALIGSPPPSLLRALENPLMNASASAPVS